jgi:hypothetical protein
VRGVDKSEKVSRSRTLYVLRNARITPQYSAVRPRLLAIMGRSIDSLIRTQGIGDLYRMYANAKRDGMTFKAMWIPDEFTLQEPKPFDNAYMRALFDLGYRMGRAGITWHAQPP